jgi:CRISPR/Cas system CSM-associated protein Csm2 small subunit
VIGMKRQFLVIGALLLVCSLAMCVSQTQIPDKFFEAYGKIETTQNEIDTIYNSYWDQQTKRIDYVTENKVEGTVDNKYVLSMLESELILLNEIADKNALYSSQISELFDNIKDIKGDEAKAKANDIVINLRNSQQYLGNNLARYSKATESVGGVLYYYVTDANLSDPTIASEIKTLDLDAKNDFLVGDDFLGQYYLEKDEANATYQELKKLK